MYSLFLVALAGIAKMIQLHKLPKALSMKKLIYFKPLCASKAHGNECLYRRSYFFLQIFFCLTFFGLLVQ